MAVRAIQFFISFSGGIGWGMYVASDGDARIWLNAGTGAIASTGQHYVGSDVVWNAGNDGAGTGLDADLLDAQQGSYYLDYTNFTNTPDIFQTVAVSGQTSITADNGDDTLTFVAGSNVTLTTSGNSLTIASSGGTGGTINVTNDSSNTNFTMLFQVVGDDQTEVHVNTTSGPTYNPSTGMMNLYGSLDIVANLDVGGTKNFSINHPSKDNYRLRHACIEGPEAAVYYRGRATIINGQCQITLPDYVKDLIHHDEEDINIQLTNIKHGKALWVDEIDIAQNCFTVGCESSGTYEFFWLLTGVRKDIGRLIVEEDKRE
jgi:hypothetical protein